MPKTISVWIMADQLRTAHPALLAAERKVGRDRVRIVMVESLAWMRRLPFHRKRQVLYLSAGRHFAAELAQAGYKVDLRPASDSREGLAAHIKKHKSSQMLMTAGSEYQPRRWQEGVMSVDLGIEVEILPNTFFLVGQFDPIPNPEPGKRYVMENFYRAMRKHFQILIEPDGKPTGGTWNLDAENRKSLPRGLRVPQLPSFAPDEITQQVIKEVDGASFGVGTTDGFQFPVTRADSEQAFADFLAHRLPLFGVYEDAMSRTEGILFHSVLSPQMNLGLLDPLTMARAAEAEFRAGRAPLNSVEGFIRQVIGWREFMYWQYHRQMPELREANAWNGTRPTPQMMWDGITKMECIRSVVGRLLESGYTHHIERLMILTNFSLLAGLDPASVADWFLTFYADSHDWVVLPNVIGMGMNADGGITATKPYISSSAYIHKMSNFCGSCSYQRDERIGDDACPFNRLYWNFLIENEAKLRANPRFGPAVLGLKRISESDRLEIRKSAHQFLSELKPYDE